MAASAFGSQSALVSSLNERWRRGAPADNLPDAGLLVHVMDGDGITKHGFTRTRLPPSGHELWERLGRPNAEIGWGDHVSCSIINARAPTLYQPLNVPLLVSLGYANLPFVVLASDEAVQARVNCCFSMDAGTVGASCSTRGGDESCTPGCSVSYGQLHKMASWNHYTHPPLDAGPHGADALRTCLENMEIRVCGNENVWCGLAYNEVVLDNWNLGPWDANQMVLAVGVARGAAPAAVELARAVHDAAITSRVRVPLLWYDRHATDEPFTVMVDWPSTLFPPAPPPPPSLPPSPEQPPVPPPPRTVPPPRPPASPPSHPPSSPSVPPPPVPPSPPCPLPPDSPPRAPPALPPPWARPADLLEGAATPASLAFLAAMLLLTLMCARQHPLCRQRLTQMFVSASSTKPPHVKSSTSRPGVRASADPSLDADDPPIAGEYKHKSGAKQLTGSRRVAPTDTKQLISSTTLRSDGCDASTEGTLVPSLDFDAPNRKGLKLSLDFDDDSGGSGGRAIGPSSKCKAGCGARFDADGTSGVEFDTINKWDLD